MYSKRHILTCCIMEGSRTSIDTEEIHPSTMRVVNTMKVKYDYVVGEKLTSVELIKLDSDVYIPTSYFTMNTQTVRNIKNIYREHFSGALIARGQYVQQTGLPIARFCPGFLFNPLCSKDFHLKVASNFKELDMDVYSVMVGSEYILSTNKDIERSTLKNVLLETLHEYSKEVRFNDAIIVLHDPTTPTEDTVTLDYLHVAVLNVEDKNEDQYSIHVPDLKVKNIIEGNVVI